MFRVADSTVRGWRHTGVGPPCYKVRGRVLYSRDEVRQWLHEQRNLYVRRAAPTTRRTR